MSQVLDIIEQVLEHMYTMTEYEHHSSVMLAGDPGIGKTTFVKTLSELLGLQLTTIEIPHVSEEHLINIPFILFDPINKKEVKDKIQFEPTSNSDKERGTGYKLVLAHSNLYTLINKAQKIPDAQYLKHLYTVANPHVKELYEKLGGTETKIPDDIEHARKNHNMILFLDEYWRQTSMRIRNVLREMLNNNIGTHQIPEDVYLIYASNMRDAGGLEPQPPNAEFRTIEFKPPTKDEWFNWLKSEFQDKGHKHLDLKPEVLKAFEDGMTDADISHTDPDSSVRTSPRRWAQLIMYVNTSFPPESEADAKSLLHNVKNYFIHYSTEEYSKELRDKVAKIVAELIKKHTNIKSISHTAKNDDADWRDSFDHYIEQYKRAGGARKHVPIISGPPGIGKTMFAAQSAAKHGLRLIEIPAASLSSEDIIGMPLPGDKKDQEISVKFSAPKLHKLIMDKIEKADKDYIETLGNDKDKITEYKNQRWKYLIFFDEINTVGDDKTFNALRRVLLEKNFGPSDEKDSAGKHIDLKIPKEAIVFAALNPEGSHTRPITDHFRDVIDIIPAKASWPYTKKWLQSKTFESKSGKKIDSPILDVSMNIISDMIDRFKTKDANVPENRKPFTFEIDSAQLQMSPRALSDMYIALVHTMDINVKKALDRLNSDDKISPAEIRKDIDKKIARTLESSMNNAFYREQFVAERDDFADKLPVWVQNLPDSIFNGILNKKIKTSQSLTDTLDAYLSGKKDVSHMAEDEHITNTNTSLSDSDVIEEVTQILARHIKTEDDVKKYVLEQSEDKVELNADGTGLVKGAGKTNKIINFSTALFFTLHLYNFNHARLNTILRGTTKGFANIKLKMDEEEIIDPELSSKAAGVIGRFRMEMLKVVNALKDKG